MDEYQTQEERRIWIEKLNEKRWSKEETKDEDDLLIAGSQDFQPKDRKHLDYCKHCGIPFSEHLGVTPTCAQHMEAQKKLQTIFALVEAHYEEAYYRRTTADKKLWQAVLGLKDSTGI